MNEQVNDGAVDQHYSRADLTETILAGLRAAGKNPDALVPTDLAPVDQFHTRGRDATLELARRAGVRAGLRVLDVGGGIGGAARTLVTEYSCHVTVLDLTEEYCRAGELLTARTGLADQVVFRHGSAVDIPFPDASFDVVWTQHSTMNIADKPRLYAELFRVVRGGGRLALHEIMAGPLAPVHFPVPWAREPAISHLLRPDQVRAIIAEAGFQEVDWIDETALATAWFTERVAAIRAAQGVPPPLGLHLLLGADSAMMFANLARNLTEQRVVVFQGLFERPVAPNALDAGRVLIDLSHTVENGMITYKGLPAPLICDYLSREQSRKLYAQGTEFQIGKIEMVANTGTYLDSPFHRYADGKDLAELDLAVLADLDGVVVRVARADGRAITGAAFGDRDVRGKAVLVHTGWDAYWRTDQYFEGHPFLTEDAAMHLAGAGATLVGIDSFNIDDIADGRRPVHTILLGAEIPIVEHLCGLDRLPEAGFKFFAVPVKVKGFGTFPVRAFAIVQSDRENRL
jgi:kynurenine formamidase/SAM-dependent methyltransferase